MKKNDTLLKTYEVMEILKITRSQLYRLMKDNRIKAINIGRGDSRADWRIKQSDVDKFLIYEHTQ